MSLLQVAVSLDSVPALPSPGMGFPGVCAVLRHTSSLLILSFCSNFGVVVDLPSLWVCESVACSGVWISTPQMVEFGMGATYVQYPLESLLSFI